MKKKSNFVNAFTGKAPQVFSYLDYRKYLTDMYEHLRRGVSRFSLRFFARMAGFGSPSFLTMVIDGERNLSSASITQLATAFKLKRKEAAYFETLVWYNQATGDSEKQRYYDQLMTMRPQVQIDGLDRDKYEYVTNDLFVVIREMSALKEFESDAEWIQRHLRFPTKLKDIQHALEVLERLELLVRDESGKLVHSGSTLETPVNVDSLEVINYHRQVLTEAKDAMIAAPADEWDVASMTLPIPLELLPEIYQMLRNCREAIVSRVNESKGNYHEVFHINMQVYPSTKTKSINKTTK